MRAKEALVKIGVYDLDATKIYDFKLIPCNEGQSMSYLETRKGNTKDLLERCDEIVSGLKSIFPAGNFSVLIENASFSAGVFFIPSIGLLDDNGNFILDFNKSK